MPLVAGGNVIAKSIIALQAQQSLYSLCYKVIKVINFQSAGFLKHEWNWN